MRSSLFIASALLVATNGHMSVQHPLVRNSDEHGNNYLVWQSNEPMVPARPEVCHGLPAGPIPSRMQYENGNMYSFYANQSLFPLFHLLLCYFAIPWQYLCSICLSTPYFSPFCMHSACFRFAFRVRDRKQINHSYHFSLCLLGVCIDTM